MFTEYQQSYIISHIFDEPFQIQLLPHTHRQVHDLPFKDLLIRDLCVRYPVIMDGLCVATVEGSFRYPQIEPPMPGCDNKAISRAVGIGDNNYYAVLVDTEAYSDQV